ncbi:hypothetical protein FRC09_017265 [Ceratobasidium sp. 395]|nr:hypothetical protein FRC09_017265 [Ceratobasidium sp. 395]
MSPPEQSDKSADKAPSDISRHLISIEYKGRRAVIRRSVHYDVTISSVKKAFRDLRDVSTDDIVLSAFLKEFDNTVEVPEEAWPTVLPEIKTPSEEKVTEEQSKSSRPRPRLKSKSNDESDSSLLAALGLASGLEAVVTPTAKATSIRVASTSSMIKPKGKKAADNPE